MGRRSKAVIRAESDSVTSCSACGESTAPALLLRCAHCQTRVHRRCIDMMVDAADQWVCGECSMRRPRLEREADSEGSEWDEIVNDSGGVKRSRVSSDDVVLTRKGRGKEKKRKSDVHEKPVNKVLEAHLLEDAKDPYFQNIHRLGLNQHSLVTTPSDPACALYYDLALPDFRERIKLICKRQGITQTQLADRLDFNNGNMSGTLKGSYAPASHRVYIYTLAQWAYQMDRKFVDNFVDKKYRKLNDISDPEASVSTEALASMLSYDDIAALESYINFEMNPIDRSTLDQIIVDFNESLLRIPLMQKAATPTPPRPTPKKPSKAYTPRAGVPPKFAKFVVRPNHARVVGPITIDRATEDVFRSWHPAAADYTELPLSMLSKFICDDYAKIELRPSPTSNVLALDAFASYVHAETGDVFINAGGPISCAEWVPVGTNDILPSSLTQYLLVCAAPTMANTNAAPVTPVHGAALIQLYRFDVGQTAAVDMCLGLAIEGAGAVISAQFCPYPESYQPINKDQNDPHHVFRLGILACAFADGSMQIFSIPHPECVTKNGTATSLVRVAPVFRYTSNDFSVYTLRWHPTNDTGNLPLILAGTHQGSALLWDIRTATTAPELVTGVSRTANDCVMRVTWSAHDPWQFVIGTHSGIVRLFDLRSPNIAIWSFDLFRPVYGIEPMREGDGYWLAVANGLKFLSVSGGTTTIPPFWADLPFEAITPMSMSILPSPGHIIMSIATNNGCAVTTTIESITAKSKNPRRTVQVVSYTDSRLPSTISTTGRYVLEYGILSPSAHHIYRKGAATHDPNREHIRIQLPQHSSADLLLKKELRTTTCSFNANMGTDSPVFVSGGRAGIVRVQYIER